MTDRSAWRPRRSLRRLVVLIASAGLLSTLAIGAADAKPTRPAPKSRAAAAAAALPSTDISMNLPRTRHEETTGRFLNEDYDLRAVVEDGRLNIYDPPIKGGGLRNSVTTDLTPPGNSANHALWQPGAISTLADAQRLAGVLLAWTPDGLYMVGNQGVGGAAQNFKTVLYKLPATGTCASRACALWSTEDTDFGSARLPSYYASAQPYAERSMGATSIAVGKIGTQSVVAVGLSDAGGLGENGGVHLVNGDDGGRMGRFLIDVAAPNAAQTATTALAWDPAGSGWLAIGTTSPTRTMYATRVTVLTNPFGVSASFSRLTYYDVQSGDDYTPAARSAAVGQRADGSPIMAYGMSDGSINLFDPAATSKTLLSTIKAPTNPDDAKPVDAMTFVDRIDGTEGAQDLVAVSSTENWGQVLRYSGATTLAPQALTPASGAAGVTSDVGGIRAWYPGYRTGRLDFTNNVDSGEPIRIRFASRPNAGYGCWFAPAFDDRQAFPGGSITLTSGQSSAGFTVGGYTASTGGACAATDSTGEWAAYVVITPTRRPADTVTAKLTFTRAGQLNVTPVGGSLQLRTRSSDSRLPLGNWSIGVIGPRASQSAPPLTLNATRLDAGETDQPIYRLDVPASTWSLPPVTPPRVQAVLEPIRVIGRTAAGQEVPLGLLAPQGPPTRSTTGTITLAPISFYWENTDTGPQIDSIYVRSGATLNSRPVSLPGIPTPASAGVDEVVICPASGTSGCDTPLTPEANGLDQAAVRIQLKNGGQAVPLTDGAYGRVYYRDDNNDLLTGLIPADGSAEIRVSPYPGAYPNDGSAGTTRPPVNAPVGGRFGYVSTNTLVRQEITGYVGGTLFHGAPFPVQATDFVPQLSSGARAADGFYLTGCSDYTGSSNCRITKPTATAPALFYTSDPDTGELRIGLQFSTVGQTAASTLPLQQLANQPVHTVASSTMDINNGEVSLGDASGFQPADKIDTYLVTHGQQLPIANVTVGGGN